MTKRRLLLLLVFAVVAIGGLKAGQSIIVQNFSVMDLLGPGSTPGNPSAGKGRFYYDKGSSELVCKNSDGSSCAFGGAGAGTVTTTGSPASGQVAFFTGASSISSNANFAWNNTAGLLSVTGGSGTGAGVATFTSNNDSDYSLVLNNAAAPTATMEFLVNNSGETDICMEDTCANGLSYNPNVGGGHGAGTVFILADAGHDVSLGRSGGGVIPGNDNLMTLGSPTFRWSAAHLFSSTYYGSVSGSAVFGVNTTGTTFSAGAPISIAETVAPTATEAVYANPTSHCISAVNNSVDKGCLAATVDLAVAPANTPAVTGKVLRAYDSTTGAYTQGFLPTLCSPQFSTTDTISSSTSPTETVFATNCAVPANLIATNVAISGIVTIDWTATATVPNTTFRIKLCTVAGCGSGTVKDIYTGTTSSSAAGTFSAAMNLS